MDPRVERLHAAAEHLRDLGQLLDRRRVDPALREMLGGAAACDEVDSEVLETLRELDQPGLVPGGQEGATDHSIRPRTVSGRRRCSTAWTRARSVSTVSSVVHRHRLGDDHGAGVDAFIDVVDGRGGLPDSRGEDVLDRVRAGEVRQRRRVRVHDPAGEAVDERLAQQVHVAGADHERHALRFEPAAHRVVPLLSRLEVLQRKASCGDTGPPRALQRRRCRPVRRDAGDGEAGVEQRLEVRALAGDQDADHAATIRPITLAAARLEARRHRSRSRG